MEDTSGTGDSQNVMYVATVPKLLLYLKNDIVPSIPYIEGGFATVNDFEGGAGKLLIAMDRVRRFAYLVRNPINTLTNGRVSQFLRRLDRLRNHFVNRVSEEEFDPTDGEVLDNLVDRFVVELMLI